MNKLDIVPKSQFLKRMIEYPRPSLIEYVNDVPESQSTAIIICVGGGYSVYGEAEGFPLAKRLENEGYIPFLLCYSLGEENPFPVALLELGQAVSHIKNNHKEYNVNPNNVVVCGLSAGGHLAASLGVYWNEPRLREMGLQKNCKPDRLILGYPVTGEVIDGFGRTFETLSANLENPDLEPLLYLDSNLNENMPPTFIWHNVDDEVIPIYSTLKFIEKLKEKNIPFEAHFFPKGGHAVHKDEEGITLALKWLS